jgi:hypothetical protein
MTDIALPADAWLGSMRSEYLDRFVREGGAAIKVAVVPSAATSTALTRSLLLAARERGFLTAGVDAASCRTHLLHNLFHEIARQVDWEGLARDFVRRLVLGAGLAMPEDGALDVGALARASEQDVTIVMQDLRVALTKELMRDRGLSRQFRLGMLALCKAILEPDELRVALAAHVQLWLRGDLPRVGPLRDAFIHQRVDRHSARTMILSTAAFARKAGREGLVAAVDVSRYALPRPLDDGRNRYSKSAALDMWETLRQFVDATDDLNGGFFVFIVGREFVEDEQRGLRGYNALHLRLTDDVRDRRRANPLAPMVRISETGPW